MKKKKPSVLSFVCYGIGVGGVGVSCFSVIVEVDKMIVEANFKKKIRKI